MQPLLMHTNRIVTDFRNNQLPPTGLLRYLARLYSLPMSNALCFLKCDAVDYATYPFQHALLRALVQTCSSARMTAFA